MSRKRRRPVIAGVRPEGRDGAEVCKWCFNLPHRRIRVAWIDPDTKAHRTDCPGCEKSYSPEVVDLTGNLEDAAWELLENQHAREAMGVTTFEQALAAVADLHEPADPGGPEGAKRGKICNWCSDQSWRRPPDGPCGGCGKDFAPEMISIATGMQSSLAGFMDLESIG